MKKKIGKGKAIEELVKGSMDYTMQLIHNAFRAQFAIPDLNGGTTLGYYINEIFSDYVIVSEWVIMSTLKTDEYFKVTYSKSGDVYIFAAREAWEIVELTYQPRTAPSKMAEERRGKKKIKKSSKFSELIEAHIILLEKQDDAPRKIKIEKAMTANIVNGNGRRYPAEVIHSAVAELRDHLNETAGQGRAVQILGEAEHPSDKGGRANLLETVVKWDDIIFDGHDVAITGSIMETNKGKDLLALMEGGVMPGVSLRGYGESKNVKEGDQKIFEVTELHITGFDLVLEPSFENSATLIESNHQGDDVMNLEELLKLMKEHPELFEGMNEAQIKKMGEAQLKALEEKIREALGIDASANLAEALKANAEKARKFDEMEKKQAIEAAITEATKDLPFGKEYNEAFVEALKEAELTTPDAVKKFAENKRKEYGKLASKVTLKNMGFTGKISGVAPVLESETGTPQFARASFQMLESLRKSENLAMRDLSKGETGAEIFTRRLLERFDQLHKKELMAESKAFEEAEQTSDLNLPYSVSRAVMEEAFPSLVAAGILDVGVIDTSPTRLYFEATTGESGYTATITDEVVTGGAEGVWYDLAYGRVTPDSVTVSSNPAGTTYVEGTDYVIDYAAGRIKFLAAGDIGANDVLVDYSYTAIRKGEMSPIERVKTSLSYITIEAAADRLADQISREAIVFSRSQIGWDAVARTMANLVRQVRRKIDQGLLYWAFSSVKAVASNYTATWTVGTDQTDYEDLVRLMGNAAVIVAKRFYEPTFFLMSVTNADRLSNWEGFKRDGWPNAILNAAGYAGTVKNKPIFASTEFPDSLIIAGNRELVQHRVFQPLSIRGPFPTYDVSGGTSKLVAADQYYAEEFNVTESPINEKGAYVPVEESGS